MTYRLRERFVIYDPDRGAHLWREWREGTIVTDPDESKLLEARGAPVEKIEIDRKLSSPIPQI
jgi:hypothetical protein